MSVSTEGTGYKSVMEIFQDRYDTPFKELSEVAAVQLVAADRICIELREIRKMLPDLPQGSPKPK